MIGDRQRVGSGRSAQAIKQVRRLLPKDSVSVAGAIREQHGTDESWHIPAPPDAVVYPASTEEVASVVRICAENRVPVIAFGAGTSLEGHVAATRGGISLDTSRLNRVREVNLEDLDCLVEAGVHRIALNERLRREGVFFPVDPGADATIGGMASTRASGTNTVRYGTMRENVLGLTVVLADGKVIRTGGRARKSSAGYDLTRLFVGAEGTLGVITEIRLRIYPLPDVIAAAVCGFPSVTEAVEACIECIQLGIPVARIELLNQVQMAACNRRSDLGLPERPTLFIELHGGEAAVKEAAEAVEIVTKSHGGASFEWTTDPKVRDRLWTARHQAYYAALALRPGARALTTDVCVPISRLAECIVETERDLEREGTPSPIVGHVGDGNFHVVYLFDPLDVAELSKARGFHERLVHRALAMGGTCTGEHGIGYGKVAFLREEHGDAVDTMVAIKAALDPYGIMNPGKIISVAPSTL
jgi:D-lactate dehydrogenase (cytochrome)